MSKNSKVDIAFLALAVVLLVLMRYYALSVWWLVSIVGVYSIVKVLGVCNLDWEYFMPVKSKAKIFDKRIALTFDDGPLPENTLKILSILKEHTVPAAFFCIGNRIVKHPLIAKEIHQQGHIIGNHSYFHKATFPLQRTQAILAELRNTDHAIRDITGKHPRFFRPPFGVIHPLIANAVMQTNHITIGWGVRSFDTMIKDPEVVLQRILKRVKPGDIILLHDYSDSMVRILPELISTLKEKGFTFERVDTLLNEKAYV
jgi:peptidoglycan/xylan/chitin deacetylase (PgdA/CDA1 family)